MRLKHPPTPRPRCANCGSSATRDLRFLSIEDGGGAVHLCVACDRIHHNHFDDKAKRDQLLKDRRDYMVRLRGDVYFPMPTKREDHIGVEMVTDSGAVGIAHVSPDIQPETVKALKRLIELAHQAVRRGDFDKPDDQTAALGGDDTPKPSYDDLPNSRSVTGGITAVLWNKGLIDNLKNLDGSPPTDNE